MTDSLATVAWQFNEAVSMLREASATCAPGIRQEIEEGLPAIQEALERCAALAQGEGSTAHAPQWGTEMAALAYEAGVDRHDDLPADTPEPPPESCKTCQDRGWVWEGNASAGEGTPADCPDPVHASDYAPATPEGGEPTDDELLARAEWDIKVLRAGDGTADIGDDMAELAAALRDARRKSSVEIRHLIDKCDRLERELAEARSHGEVLARVTTQSSGYARRLPDGSFDADDGGTTSRLPHIYHLAAPPGTEVLVVRPVEDQEETEP